MNYYKSIQKFPSKTTTLWSHWRNVKTEGFLFRKGSKTPIEKKDSLTVQRTLEETFFFLKRNLLKNIRVSLKSETGSNLPESGITERRIHTYINTVYVSRGTRFKQKVDWCWQSIRKRTESIIFFLANVQ